MGHNKVKPWKQFGKCCDFLHPTVKADQALQSYLTVAFIALKKKYSTFSSVDFRFAFTVGHYL